MPMDNFGKYRINHQMAAHSNRAAEGRAKGDPIMAKEREDGGSGSEHTELHDHGDGSYHTVIGGEKTEHPHLGHALMYMAGHHEPEGIHHHAHHDGMETTAHHVADGGEVEGPHHMATPEETGEHVAQVMSGESAGHHEPDGDEEYSGMHALAGM